MEGTRDKIEVIEKRANKVYFVSDDYNIKYKEELILLKELQKENNEINKIIYQEDGFQRF